MSMRGPAPCRRSVSSLQRWIIVVAAVALAGMFSSAAVADEESKPSGGRLTLTPYFGLVSQSEYYEDFVLFLDGDRDFLLIEPESGPTLGIELAYSFKPKLAGYVQLSYASTDARYVEDDNLRPDVDFDMVRFELGVRYTLAALGAKRAPLFGGGGLSLTSHSVSGMAWSGRPVDASATSIGVHGLLGIDYPVGPRLSLRGALKISFTPLELDELENEIIQAEGELAELDGETSRVVELQFGLTILL